jgi:integrase
MHQMGMIYRKRYTMPLPPGAEITERDGRHIARWRSRTGHVQTGEVIEGQNGQVRVRGRSPFYMAQYRDSNGQKIEVATRCKDPVAARQVLAELERRVERIRAGLLTLEESDAVDHASQPLSSHLNAYEKHLQAKGGDSRRISMLCRRLERIFSECRMASLSRLSVAPIETWLVERAGEGMASATRNSYREALVGFGNWCRRTRRLTTNPFADLPLADQNADRRHQRRALTEDELVRLLYVARLRPLAERGRDSAAAPKKRQQSPRSRATWKLAALTYDNINHASQRAREVLEGNPELIAKLERIGKERSLIYTTLALTGLRKGELSSLSVAQLDLGSPVPYAVLYAADEKNRRGSNIPIHTALAAELSDWLADQLRDLQDEARRNGDPIPARLPGATPLFNVPSGFTRIFDRDLAAAGIPKRDERNRVLDIHALRVTFCTRLCAAGVPLRTAQAAMRHSKPELTANIYTDPKLLDVAGAINTLPSLATPREAAVSANGRGNRRRAIP